MVDWYQGWWTAKHWAETRMERGDAVAVYDSPWTAPIMPSRLIDSPLKTPSNVVWMLVSADDRQLHLSHLQQFQEWAQLECVIGGCIEVYRFPPSQMHGEVRDFFRIATEAL